MIVEIEQKVDSEEYQSFLKEKRDSTFYHSIKHLTFLSDLLNSKPNFVTARQGTKLLGIMPFFVKDSIYGKVVNSLPFFGSYGGCVCDTPESQIDILHYLNTFNMENDVLSSVIIVSPFSQNKLIYEKHYQHNLKEDRLVQCLVLGNKSELDIWNTFEQRVRRAIRKSTKHEIEANKAVLDDTVVESFYKMHKTEMELKNGRPKPIDFFRCLKNNFLQGEDYDVLAAVRQGEAIAYLLVFYFYPFTEYYMPAYKSELKHTQATSLLIWESIKESIKKKMSYYNFGGTWKNQTELYLYKRGWHSTDFTYNYYICGDLTRVRSIGIDEIKKNYPYFYVFSYDDIKKAQDQ